MAGDNKLIEDQELQAIEDIFQDTIKKLRTLHDEKLDLIKKFRAENNLAELNKIRENL